MEPAEFFAVAAVLGNTGFGNTDEARSRSAVSRLYYGCHHEACAVIRLQPPRRGRHTWAIAQIRLRGDPIAARMLDRMRRERQRADYDLAATWRTDLRLVVALTERFRRRIGTLP